MNVSTIAKATVEITQAGNAFLDLTSRNGKQSCFVLLTRNERIQLARLLLNDEPSETTMTII